MNELTRLDIATCVCLLLKKNQLDIGSAKSKLASYRLDYGWSYGDLIYRNSELDRKKMELEKLTFTHGAYRDKKAVLYFSFGREPEVNIHVRKP